MRLHNVEMKRMVIYFFSIILFISSAFAGEDGNLLIQGNNYLTQGFYDEAIIQYQKALRSNPDNAQAYYGLGTAYSQKGDFNKPISCYQNAVGCNPDDAQTYYNLGLAYENTGELAKAIECFQKTIKINPNCAEAYHSLGDVYGLKGNYKREMEYFKKAIQLNPLDIEVYYISPIAYGQKIIYDKAIVYFQKAIQLKPDYTDAYYGLGSLYAKMGKIYCFEIHFDRELRCWKKLIQLNPNDANLYLRIALIYRQKDKNNKAMHYLQKAIHLRCSNMSIACYNLGEIYFEKKHDYNKAIKYFLKTIQFDPAFADAYCKLGIAYAHMQDKNGALEQLTKLRQLDACPNLVEKLDDILGTYSHMPQRGEKKRKKDR